MTTNPVSAIRWPPHFVIFVIFAFFAFFALKLFSAFLPNLCALCVRSDGRPVSEKTKVTNHDSSYGLISSVTTSIARRTHSCSAASGWARRIARRHSRTIFSMFRVPDLSILSQKLS